jgi:hypothetical protein
MSDEFHPAQEDMAPRVAIVAVHGVNTNEQFETARSIAKMLLRHGSDGVEYPDFKEIAEHVFVERLKIVPDDAAAKDDKPHSWFDERPPSIRRAQQQGAKRDPSEAPPDIQYATDQLRQYQVQGNDAFYDTIRIDGVRSGINSEARCNVHVFELFWADLSRRAFGAFQGFIEIYQILFFLCGLGRKTLDFTRARHPGSFWWQAFGSTQVVAERILVLGVPIINLCLLAVGSVFLPVLFAQSRILLIGLVALYAGVLSGAAIVSMRRKWMDEDGSRWAGFFLPIGLIALAAGGLAALIPSEYENRAVGTVWVVTALSAVLIVCKLYDRLRRGALFSGFLIAAPTAILGAVEFWLLGTPKIEKSDQFLMLDRVVRTGEWLLTVLNVAWLIFLLFLFFMTISEWFATRHACRCEFPQRCRRAAWTAQITMLLPASLIVILTSAFWKLLIELLPRLPGTKLLAQVPSAPINLPGAFARLLSSGVAQLSAQLAAHPDQPPSVQNVLQTMIDAQGNDLAFLCLALSVAAALAIWALVPVIAAEIRPPAERSQKKATWMGSALNTGFLKLRLAGEILRWVYLGSFVVCFAGLAMGLPTFDSRLGATLIAMLGCTIGLILTASQGPLSFLALGFKSAIDVALDVIAWLQIRPANQNPKGRICARFVSLLRHICKEHQTGAHYRAIVIVAHSQGAIISADLLRYLFFQKKRSELDSTLNPLFTDELPIYLMTFGSPLRQLYDLRFPDLYGWSFRPNHAVDEGPCIRELGVRAWLNGYRSGDYVGRFLWHKENDPDAWTLGSVTGKIKHQQDCCLGEGAHTHYFDETSPNVPIWLNRVISKAIGAEKD